MSFGFAPKGWALCNGQLLPINQNQALFSLLGTTYGGDGRTNFALPDLRTRTPIHFGSGYSLGQKGGEASHTLNQTEMPSHTHTLEGTNTSATLDVPGGNVIGQPSINGFGPAANPGAMNPGTIANTGGSQAHENMQPYTTLSFCIALQGIFPSPN